MSMPRCLALALCALASCAALQPERRLAPADFSYQVKSVTVVPFSLTYHGCPEDIDRRARTADLFGSVTGVAAGALRRRGYTVEPLMADPDDPHLKAYYKALDRLLCSGALPSQLPPEVLAYAEEEGQKAKSSTVLIGGVSRLRWHLKLDNEQDNGLVGTGKGTMSQFTVRAATALVDLDSKRVVWSESVEGTLLANDYVDAINQLFLFGQLRTTDPHDRLFYDFPTFPGAVAEPAAASTPVPAALTGS